ncbi:SgcJ/EcaC family oxidoreductase [Nocardia sp. NPDC052278]
MSSEHTSESVQATFEAMSETWARQDTAQFAACYTHDATVIGPGIYLRGRDDISRSMAAAFAGPLKDSPRPHSTQMVRFLPGGGAIVITKSATIFPGETVAPPDRQHLVTWILHYQEFQ